MKRIFPCFALLLFVVCLPKSARLLAQDATHSSISFSPSNSVRPPLAKVKLEVSIADTQYVYPGEKMRYRLDFQNIGDAPVEHAWVLDSLAPLFVAASAQLISASHSVSFSQVSAGVLQFFFEHISLSAADSGFVEFSLVPNPAAQGPADLPNRCSVVFDQNTPVASNLTSKTLKEVLRVGVDLVHCGNDPFPDTTPDTMDLGHTATIFEVGVQDFDYRYQNDTVFVASGSVFLGVVIHQDTVLFDTVPTPNYPCPTQIAYHIKLLSASGAPSAQGFEIYPNPASGRLIFEAKNLPDGRVNLLFFNSLGCLSKAVEWQISSAPQHEMDLSDLPAGGYSVQVVLDGKRWLGRDFVLLF